MLTQAGNASLLHICPLLLGEGLEGEWFDCHDRKETAISTDAEQTYMPDDTVQRSKEPWTG